MRALTILALVALLSFQVEAQEVKRIKGAKGEYMITGGVSEEEAKSKALAEAKVNALKMAGVSESIKSYDMLYKGEVGAKYEEVYMSDKQAEIRGAIKDYTVTYVKGMDEYSNFKIQATIDATVILYKNSPDPAFSAFIDGIKKGYQTGEKLTYKIIPSQNCYLYIFNIYSKNATLTFPNAYEKQQMLEAEKIYTFPLNKNIEYPLERTTPEPEQNKLLFVFTKDPIPYVKISGEDQSTKFEDVSSWLFSIPPDRRINQYIQFVIY